MTVEGGVNATVFREFLKRLIAGMTRKIFLIVDGHPMHKAKLVQRFVQENSEAIELFFLPPYAPALNPDEPAWAHIKTQVAKATVQTRQELKTSVEVSCTGCKNYPESQRVSSAHRLAFTRKREAFLTTGLIGQELLSHQYPDHGFAYSNLWQRVKAGPD